MANSELFKTTIPGSICIFTIFSTNVDEKVDQVLVNSCFTWMIVCKTTALIDGQHRMKAAAEILARHDQFFDLLVVVDLISVSSQQEIEELADIRGQRLQLEQQHAPACINISNTLVIQSKQRNCGRRARTNKSSKVQLHQSLHTSYLCVHVEKEWREENGFEVWEIQAWNSDGFPTHGKQWIQHHSLPEQKRGSFKFCRKPGKAATRLVDENSVPLWAPSSWSQARFSEHLLTIASNGRSRLKVFQYVMLDEEQEQVLHAHKKLLESKS
eukprot:758417-Hanusia_phi.AAC.6